MQQIRSIPLGSANGAARLRAVLSMRLIALGDGHAFVTFACTLMGDAWFSALSNEGLPVELAHAMAAAAQLPPACRDRVLRLAYRLAGGPCMATHLRFVSGLAALSVDDLQRLDETFFAAQASPAMRSPTALGRLLATMSRVDARLAGTTVRAVVH
ncbi:MAG: hypothetical protein EOO40_01880, partial [Deltaproteobacteria bacterium]